MEQRNNKKHIIFMVISIIVVLITGFGIAFYIKDQNYKKSDDYKLKQIGYNEEEIVIIKQMNDNQKKIIFNNNYNDKMIDLVQKQYFLEKNLDKYLSYSQKHPSHPGPDHGDRDRGPGHGDLRPGGDGLHVGADKEWYTDPKQTEISYNNSLLTNKFYQLSEDYEPTDLKDISNVYSYGENQKLRNDAYNAFIEMFNDAKKENVTLIINSSYRSYQDQKETYEKYLTWYGEDETNKLAAKPGFSEHQTGLAVDIQTYGSNKSNFEQTDAFKWLQDNAYKYGFILRYPKDKEYLTGYSYESWHYRYVGTEIAQYIKDNNITFDEYYAFFIEE